MGIGDETTLELTGEKAAEEVEAGRGVFAVEAASRRHCVTSRRHAATSRRRCVASSASRSPSARKGTGAWRSNGMPSSSPSRWCSCRAAVPSPPAFCRRRLRLLALGLATRQTPRATERMSSTSAKVWSTFQAFVAGNGSFLGRFLPGPVLNEQQFFAGWFQFGWKKNPSGTGRSGPHSEETERGLIRNYSNKMATCTDAKTSQGGRGTTNN
jgi:hypothetical protein